MSSNSCGISHVMTINAMLGTAHCVYVCTLNHLAYKAVERQNCVGTPQMCPF